KAGRFERQLSNVTPIPCTAQTRNVRIAAVHSRAVEPVKQFDLNIEKVLEDWGVAHALREVIANALDEQVLTKTKDIGIAKGKDGRWHVRDYGRGLKYEHLTQNENHEKLSRPELVIGKFGVG